MPKNSWSSVMFVGAGRAWYGVDLIWFWVDAISIIKTAEEIDSWGLYMCFLLVEH